MKKFPDSQQRIGLVANVEKAACRPLLRKAVRLIRAAGREAVADEQTAAFAGLKTPACPDAASLARRVDLLMVFGGDGTMLRVARAIAGSATPMVGINVGGLGFLTDVQSHRLTRALQHMWAGAVRLETRHLLEAQGTVQGAAFAAMALNDFVVTRGGTPRLIELEVRVDGEVLTQYRCDGLIVCSPTGSTAYSLAAGGAVVSPVADVFTITPICPHTLSNRSVIVSLRSTVEVEVLSRRVETVLTVDGQKPLLLAGGDIITIRQSRRAIRLLHLAGSSFFRTLRHKLDWSGSHV